MQEKEHEYTILLTDEDWIKNRFVTKGPEIIEFSVQYETLVESNWRKVMRIDSSHSGVHRHIFHPYDAEYQQPFPCTDLNNGLTKAQTFFREQYHSIKSNYLTELRRRRL